MWVCGVMNLFLNMKYLRAPANLFATTGLISVLAVMGAHAQSPQGGVVASGNAQISSVPNTTIIDQSSQRAVIDWRSFDVGRDHSVTFNQPNAAAATLNRVDAIRPSIIEGAINANGSVIIQNTAGVLFSGSARVDASGLVATSQNVDADHFLKSGNFRIGDGEQAGATVRNEGTFTIKDAGLVALVGTQVENSGTIYAELGTVVLASGEATTIDMAGDGVFQVAVSGAPAGGKVSQSGQVTGGRVLLSAGGAAGILDSVINTSGITRAVSGTGQGGRIELVGRGGGAVSVGGTLVANGSSGGQIDITGAQIAVQQDARIDASGIVNGGEIRIGGDLQGGGELTRSKRTVLHTGSEINADGGDGKGGTVIVWSDGDTWFDALISAVGPQAGGFVETSGKENLGTGDAAQVKVGAGGQWLLDPRNVRIAGRGTNVGAGTNNPPEGSGDFVIRRASITNALNAGSDVTITTAQPANTDAGNITVATNLRWSGSGSLTLDADTSIFVNRNIRTSGAGNLTLKAGDLIDINNVVQTRGSGSIALDAGGDIRFDRPVNSTAASSGSVAANAAGSIFINRTTTINGSGDMTLTAGDSITVNNRLNTARAGNLSLTAENNVTLNNNVFANRDGNVAITSNTGDILLGGANGNQRVSTNRGDLSLTATTGSVRIERTNGRPRNTQVFSNSGDIDITAGTEILLKGGTNRRQLANIGRTRDSSDVTLTAPTVSVIAGDGSGAGVAQLLAGAEGSITVNADEFLLQSSAGGTQARVQARNGASLTLNADQQNWNGLVRADGSAPSGGDVTISGNVTATVAPRFNLNSGANFNLNLDRPSGVVDADGVAFNVTTTGGTINIDGALNARSSTLISDTGIALGSSAALTASGPGNALVLSAADSFENNAGADVLQVTDSGARWLLYMNNFSSLSGTEPTSGTFDLYNRPFDTTPPSSLGAFAGNRIIYAEQPELILAAVSETKTYGTDLTGALTYTVAGLRDGDSEATAIQSGVTLASAGAAADADVAGSVYALTLSALASEQGYLVTTRDGTVVVTPAALTIAALDASRDEGEANPVFETVETGFVLGETLADLGGVLTLTTPADETSPAGLFAITPAGVTSTNYDITFVDGTLTVGSLLPVEEIAQGANDAGAQSLRLLNRRAEPITPGDAAFRTTNLDTGLGQIDPFTLTFSLGEVVTFAAAPDTGGFVPASAEGFVPAAGGVETPASSGIDCGAAVNLGGASRDGCQQVVVSESYWAQ